MHYSPTADKLVYTAGLGLRPPRPSVVVREADGVEITIGRGRAPDWFANDAVQYVGDEGLQRSFAPEWSETLALPLPGGNQHVASAGRWAIARTDPRRIITSWGRGVIDGASDPALSPDGEWFAYVQVTGGAENIVMVEPTHTPGLHRERWGGDPVDLRFGFGSTALTWGTPAGRIYGISGVGNVSAPVEELTISGGNVRSCSFARSVWTGSRLMVCMVLDQGDRAEIVVGEWGSLARKEPVGYRLGFSGGAGFDHNVAVAA